MNFSLIFKIKQEFIKNRKYIYFSLLISFLTIFPQLFISHTLRHSMGLFLLIILLSFIANLNKIIFAIFIIYINIINIVYINIFIHWGGEKSDLWNSLVSRYETIIRSPFYESIEYLQSFVDYRDYLVIGYIILIFILLYNFILKYKYKFYYNLLKIILIIISLVLFFILINKRPLKTIKEYIELRNIFINNNVILESRNQYLKNIKYQQNSNVTNKYNKIVIIIGESVNKNYMNNITSPFIFSLINSNQAYKFNAIAPTNQTRYAVPMIFTKADVNNWNYNFIHSESIVTNFKNIGYKTYWISNQGRIGKHDDWISNIANEADTKLFFNKGNYTTAENDIVISNYLKELKINKNKEMYVFHLIGSHSLYSKRYTNKYLLHKKAENIIQEYENTIYFTDKIIQNIFEYFKASENTLIVYLSDHGEVVNIKKHGHSSLPPYKDEYEIPLIIYSSIENIRIKNLYSKNKKHYFNTENMNSIIKYISFLVDDINLSTSSKVFSINPKNKFDFDELKYFK